MNSELSMEVDSLIKERDVLAEKVKLLEHLNSTLMLTLDNVQQILQTSNVWNKTLQEAQGVLRKTKNEIQE